MPPKAVSCQELTALQDVLDSGLESVCSALYTRVAWAVHPILPILVLFEALFIGEGVLKATLAAGYCK